MKPVVKRNSGRFSPAVLIGSAAVLLALGGAAAPAQAQTGPVMNGLGMCLTVTGAIASGSRLQSTYCVSNAANQTFTRTAVNELRIGGTLCVDAYGGGKQSAEVGLWTCQNSPNEKWAPTAARYLVTENNYCMAVDGGNRAAGTRIIVYTCINDPSQQWTGPVAKATTPVAPPAPPAAPKTITVSGKVDRILVNVNGTPVYLPTQLGGKCMTVEGNIMRSTTYDGARIIGYQCEGQPQARFVFMNNGQIRDHDGRNMCLDLNGTQVVTKACSDNAVNQKWNLIYTGEIKHVATGRCMDLIGGQQSWWANAVQHTFNWQQPIQIVGCNGSVEQKWAVAQALPGTANQRPTTQATIQNGQLAAVSNVISNDGGSLIATGGGNLIATGGGNIIAASGGTVIAASAGNIKMVTIGGSVIASGAGNLIATGGGNLIATGGGNLIATGGGNLISSGGGTIISAGGGNYAVMISMAQAANVIASGAGNLIRLDLGNGVVSLPYQGGTLINAATTMIMPMSTVVAIPDYR